MIKKWILTPRQFCDVEMVISGGFDPLTGFLDRQDYHSVLLNMRLASSGQLWPIPITLDVSEFFATHIEIGTKIHLHDENDNFVAYMIVSDKWRPDKLLEAEQVFGTTDPKHPGVDYLLNQAGEWYMGGPIIYENIPKHYDFPELRRTPRELRNYFAQAGIKKIVGFQTRNPIHRAHMELTLRAAKQMDAHILIHPVVGMTKPGDIDYFTRVRCYQKMLGYYPKKSATLSLLPLAMRMGGPREALWHALIRRNYGCTHFIIGRDHAGPGNNSENKPFYDPYAAQILVNEHQDEIGITVVPFQEMVYAKERKKYIPIDEIQPDETALAISGTQLRDMLLHDKPIPEWFSFPEIIKELRKTYPPRQKQGFTLFFTGLSGAGKTTLANVLQIQLMLHGKRKMTLLDGDVVRTILSNELGFSRKDRHLNIRRIGFVAAEVTKAGGVVICAAIAPYQDARHENRQLISQHGGYIEIYLSTSLETCEHRDPKGLYAKVRQGGLKGFTGIDDPYETPVNPEITLDTARLTIDESVTKIITYLQREGYLAPAETTVMETAEA